MNDYQHRFERVTQQKPSKKALVPFVVLVLLTGFLFAVSLGIAVGNMLYGPDPARVMESR